MPARDEIRALVINSFLDIVRCNERKLPLESSDLQRLESHLNWELAEESIDRWADEFPVALGEKDRDFLKQMFRHCWEHYTEDLKELKELAAEDPALER